MTARRAFLVLAVLVHLAVLYAPRLPSTDATGVPGSDKLGHVVVFALVAVAGVLARVPVRWLVPLLLAHAVGSELVQHVLLPRRSGDVWDATADVVGIALGWWLGTVLNRRWLGARAPSGPDR